jgi:hypothetical protein
MHFILIKSPNVVFKALLCCGLALLFILIQSGRASNVEDGSADLDVGFHQMYNLDFAAAHKTFETWQHLHPEDPLGPASNAAAYLFSEFERLHVLELDLFTDKRQFNDRDRTPPDPGIKAAFQSELGKADDIADKILARFSKDHNALFARILTDGLRGNYAALVENQKLAGLTLLKASRTTAEKLINLDPGYNDAYLAIGIENYILGIRSAPSRWILHLSGAQTNKDKGIANLRITAARGRYLAPYARLLLVIAALRDRDQTTAKELLADLATEFPKNRLFRIELARLEG